jgi:putative colanic acid biosynthesis UDP-glucose lipid carrier transferase
VRRRAVRAESRRTASSSAPAPLGVKVARALQGGDDAGVEFVGFFDDRTDGRIDADGQEQGSRHALRGRGLHDRASRREVYITLPLGSQPRIVELLEQLQDTTASLFFVPDVFGISIIQGRLQDMNGVPVRRHLRDALHRHQRAREADQRHHHRQLSSSFSSRPCWWRSRSASSSARPGPVLFKQRRNGLDGHEIVVYKFRSMRTMDDGEVVRQATRNDPRVTPVRRLPAPTSFDELPQFFNVLAGTMSIVGPRPHAVTHNKEYRQIIKAYMVRHKVKPASPAGRR